MRNHALLYLLRPNGEAGELDLLAESNSLWPVLWRVLFARTDSIAVAQLERVFERRPQRYLASDADAALHRLERFTRYLTGQPRIALLPDVPRFLAAAQRHLTHSVQCYRLAQEPTPVFVADLDEFAWDAAQAAASAASAWQTFQTVEATQDAQALQAVCAPDDPTLPIEAWRTWANVVGLALFTHPYFADSFRSPRQDAFDLPMPMETMEERWPHRYGYAVVLRNERYGYVDAQGNTVAAAQFDEADDFSACGVARVGKHRRYGLLRADGTLALPIEYDAVDWRSDLGGWLCRRAEQCLLLHADGTAWIDDCWNEIDVLVPQRLLRVQRGRTVGALQWSGAPAVACEYTSLAAHAACDSIQLLASRGGCMGVIDQFGRERVPFDFVTIEALEAHTEGALTTPQHLLRVHARAERSRPRAGVWDVEAARLIVPCEYDFAWIALLGEAERYGFIVANKTAYQGMPQAHRCRVGLLDADGRTLIRLEHAWLGCRTDLSKCGEFQCVREALFWAWSRGRPVEALAADTLAPVWIGPDAARAGASAAEVATLSFPDAKYPAMPTVIAAAFYQFVELPDYRALRVPLLERCDALGVKGTILLAAEGINGTIAGEIDNVRALLAYLRTDARLAQLEHKESPASGPPFHRMKVRLKREIVTMGVPEVNAARMAGTYVKPQEWNALIADPDVVLIDARNDYEVALGTFQGALNPNTRSFRELPAWLRAQPQLKNKPKVAMFCTGGIRCEKSTAFLRSEGFEHVYHLQGGILKYLETVAEAQSRWQGECFVFDERVAIGHGLTPGVHELCRSCREPVGPAEKASEFYVEGVSCPKCFHQRSAEKKRGLMERQRQVELAKRRNDTHIGVRQELKRQAKRQRRASNSS